MGLGLLSTEQEITAVQLNLIEHWKKWLQQRSSAVEFCHEPMYPN
jgi:hypothetical protein